MTTLDRQQHADTVLAETLGRLDTADADAFVTNIVTSVRAALYAAPSGSMREWMEAHDGQVVTTIQVHNGNGIPWCPTGRTIDGSTATYVQLSGSRRDYKGMRVIARTDNVLIVADDW